MFQNPTLLPQVSNRESFRQIVELADDDTGDLLTLTDGGGAALYDIELEITPGSPRGHFAASFPAPYYDDACDPSISASLADYISIVDTGTILIDIPKSVMEKLRPQTYDVFLTITDTANDDGRQLMIGRLPVFYGGRST